MLTSAHTVPVPPLGDSGLGQTTLPRKVVPLSPSSVGERTTAPSSSLRGRAARWTGQKDRESAPLAGRERWKLGPGWEEKQGHLMKRPDRKQFSSPPLWGLRLQRWWGRCCAVAPSIALGVDAEPGGAPRPGGRCASRPRLPRGRSPEPQTWRKRGDRRTEKRRNTTAGENARASPSVLPFASKGNQRQTDTQTTLH